MEILKVENLSVEVGDKNENIKAVRDVSFSLKKGEVLALVGESGCGKSILCKSLMGLLPKSGRITSGSIFVDGEDIVRFTESRLRKLRGNYFSMIFQEPMTSLDQTYPIGAQIGEAIKANNKKLTKGQVQHRILELLNLVGIENPEEMQKAYPYNFSGGMRQRVVMAIALAGNPQILLADEPTTALDVTIQAQMLNLLKSIQKKLNTSTILVSHDLGVVARAADRVAIMYAGKIVEIGTAEEIFYDARHPYTWGLMQSLPAISKGKEELYTIPGTPPSLINPPIGDAFAVRNEYALAIDYEKQPPMFQISDTHFVASWLLDERAPKIESPLKGRKNG